MPHIPGIRRFFRLERARARVEREVDDELRFHFDMTMRDLMKSGMSPDDARREANRRFGDVGTTRDRLAAIDRTVVARERRAEWWSGFAQDLRYAARGLRLKPGFAIAVVVTLGLGIGANATMFRIVDQLLFRPPAFLAHPELSARLYNAATYRGKEDVSSYTGYRRYLDLRENTTSFEAITPYSTPERAVGLGESTREMHVASTGADLWKMFDIKPVIGRFFTDAENQPPTGTLVTVLSYSFWQTQFGGRSDAVGSTIDIGPAKYTIIGVAPEGFNGFGSQPVVAFVPLAAATAADGMGNPKQPWYSTYNMNWFELFARRKPGVALATADAELTRVARISYEKRAVSSPGQTPIGLAKPRAFAGPVLRDRGPKEGNDAKVATWLVGVAAIVLLIACANVANLLLARALRRRREIAVRIALGVSRGRLFMQLITESLLLALIGGVLGLLIAQFAGAVLQRILLPDSAPSNAFTDSRVLIVALALTIVAGLLTGVAPILQMRRDDVSAALKAGSREGTVARSPLRTSLLMGQAALSVVLLVGAGLFLRSLVNVQNLRMGYDADRLLRVEINMRGIKLDSLQQVHLRDQLEQRAAGIPGVEHAARALTTPFWSTWELSLFVPGIDTVGKLGDFTLQVGSPEFFATMGTRILRGRGLSPDDREHSPLVMVISDAMGRKLWPGQDALGKCVRMNADTTPCITVVGIAEDVRRSSIGEVDLHYYLPTTQFSPEEGGLFVRTAGRASEHAEAVRRALQPLMPGSSYVTATPMSTIIAPEIRSWKIGAIMFAVFGGLALVLAAIGLYSVIAYNVTQRTHEMGVRVALGAQARDVVGLIVREGLRVVIPGVALGAIIALVAGRWIAPLLFNVSPKDPPVLVAVVLTLLGVAVVASWVPALRASRVDPNVALRAD